MEVRFQRKPGIQDSLSDLLLSWETQPNTWCCLLLILLYNSYSSCVTAYFGKGGGFAELIALCVRNRSRHIGIESLAYSDQI